MLTVALDLITERIKTLKITTSHGAWGVALLAVGVVMIVEPSSAQTVQQFVTWAIGPTLLGGMVALFVALVGVLLMAGQHTWTGIAFLVVGAVLVANATQVGGFFGGGGG